MKERIFTLRTIFQLFVFIFVVPLLPLLISERWNWAEAWVYAMVHITGFIISRYLAARKHPDLIEERARMLRHEDTEYFDRWLAPLVGMAGILIMLTVGFDARNGFSITFDIRVKIVSLVFMIAGFALGTLALMENRFFSGVVRIQKERGHSVVSGGPYALIRHPGYAGAILTYMATPIFLDSLWSILPVMFAIVVLIVRTDLEDKTLRDRLEGYEEYTRTVRYRLFPGIW